MYIKIIVDEKARVSYFSFFFFLSDENGSDYVGKLRLFACFPSLKRVQITSFSNSFNNLQKRENGLL